MGTSRTLACVAAALTLSACTDESTAPPIEEPPPEQPPEREPSSCATSEVMTDAGCVAPGIPEGACPAGFTSDGTGSCRRAFAEPACRHPSWVAHTGDAQCHPLVDCGTGTWGNIPDEPNTHWVDGSYAGDDADGSRARPWRRIRDATIAAVSGDTVAIAAGTYREALLVTEKSLTVWGRCPDMVHVGGETLGAVVGTDPGTGATAGTVIRGLSLTTETGTGLVTSDTSTLTVRDVRIHDNAEAGIIVGDHWGAAHIVLDNVLLDHNGGVGLITTGATFDVERTVVRHSRVGGLGDGRGFSLEESSGSIRDTRIFDTSGSGITAIGTDLTLEDVYVHDIRPDTSGLNGRGIQMQAATGHEPHTLDMRRVIIERASDIGLIIAGSIATIEHLIVRDTQPWFNGLGGVGAQIQADAAIDAIATVSITESVLEHNRMFSLANVSADLSIDRVIVRDTAPTGAGDQGIGIVVNYDFDRPIDTYPLAELTLRNSRVENSRVVGVSVVGSNALIENTSVTVTLPRENDGAFGDGLIVLGGPVPASATVIDSEIHDSARAGIGNWAGHVSLMGSDFDCNEIHLDGELIAETPDTPFVFEDAGDNRCGCDEEVVCKVLSTNLLPPSVQ